MTRFYQGSRGGIYYLDNDNKVYLSHSQKKDVLKMVKPTIGLSFGKKKKVTTKRTNPELWKKIVVKVKKGSKGGRPGQWSARKSQLAVKLYKEKGGGYKGKKSKNNKLTKWTRQKWRTKSGRNSIQGSRASGERYLPEKAIKRLSDKEYKQTSRKKRNSKGQYSKQPKKIAKKTKKYR